MSVFDAAQIEHSISRWEALDQMPPYTEIELLRMIDHEEHGLITLSIQTKAILYSMLIYYRMQRDVGDDHLQEQLDTFPEEQVPSIVGEIKRIKHYLSFYQQLRSIDFSQYMIRETDFDPVKLKKAKAFLGELKPLEEYSLLEQDKTLGKLTQAFYQVIEQITSLKDVLQEMVEGLEQRRTVQSLSTYHEMLDQLQRLINYFYQQLPQFLRQEQTDDPLEELQQMVGLHQIKDYMNNYYHYLKYQKRRKELGFQMVDEQGLHMVITGNPGTGKTTIARLLAEIYYQLGILRTNHVIEVNRSQLVGSFMGQSEENTLHYVQKALGGVLFIDEAYNLKREDQTGNDYGQAVIDTLVSSMTSQEYANQFAVIIAGYPEEMRHFLWANQGLRSRFPEGNFIQLPDFNDRELMDIAEQTALQNDYFFTDEALQHFHSLIEKARVDESFGNARTVKDLVLKVIFHIGSNHQMPTKDNWIEHMRITKEDIALVDDHDTQTDPMEQLEQLIGLSEVKEEVKKLSAFVEVQQQRKTRELPTVPIQLHAVFSGNPGTGKTTVAQVFAKILKNRGLLKRGHLVIASRSDLVAGFVGQTALKTKNKIREALGGVLFIDEAYALFRGDKDFGKEAIDTLVDEMTKHNENLVVILAGYQKEMEQFIASNPGLETRFKKYFHFKDYTTEELLQIAKYHVNNFDYQWDRQVENYLYKQFEERHIPGNARFVVNLINEAIQFQALRIQDSDQMDYDQLQELTKEDFELAWGATRGINE
ncbi:stage V sporulation protein K [Gracilibacillus halophilus YIM-C55.5]|uniref:Stage V sporulation protein K n=1 Tax=Gracilibacillus halophilus YIM-C55.5 TaxID=1308866 RepID=N4WRD0_9BACI|nr:AAA family ATPase [Gracilibacillus halophilus]ENH96970.1 stage V sporulation protein K [Gracilibacillus halophilus YIM-C55.5]